MKKKILKYTGITVGIIFLLLLIIPFFLKGPALKAIKKVVNEQVNAQVTFDEDISLGFIRNFPNVSLGINNICIIGKDSFSGDTLAYIPKLSLTLDLKSVMGSGPIELRKIGLKDPRIFLQTLKSGKANWDIVKTDTTQKAVIDTTSKGFKLSLKSVVIENAVLDYNDRSLDFRTRLSGLNHQSSGDFTQDEFTLKTHTESDALTLEYGGMAWLQNIKTTIDADLGMDMKKMKFSYKEAKARLNELDIQSEGFVDLNDDDMEMDISFKALQNTFKNFLSIVPGMYSKDFAKMNAAGKMAIQGSLKGKMTEDKMPRTEMSLQVENGSFRYPDLPQTAENIQMDFVFSNADGEPDNSVINLKKLQLSMAGSPFSARCLLKTPVSNPFIDAEAKGKLDLGKIKNLLPLEKGTELAGLLDADFNMIGYYSQMSSSQMKNLKAGGQLGIKNLIWKTAKVSTQLRDFALQFTPQKISMPVCIGNMNDNDFDVSGTLNQLPGYLFNNETLQGSLTFKSKNININSLMSQAETPASAAESTELPVIEIPANLDLQLTANIEKLIYEKYTLTALSGNIAAKDGILNLNNLKADMLGGHIVLNGKYDSRNIKHPLTELQTSATGFSPSTTAASFPMIQKYAPIFSKLEGLFDAGIEVKSSLDSKMQPDYKDLNLTGKLSLSQSGIKGTEFLQQLGKQLNTSALDRLNIKPQKVNFRIHDGAFELLDSIILNLPDGGIMKLSGQTKLDQTISYGGWLKMPAKNLGAGNSLLQEWNKKSGLNVKNPEEIPVDIRIGGTITKPTVSVSLKGFAKTVKENLKDAATEALEKKRAEALKLAREKGEQLKNEAAKRAAQIREEGKKRGSQLTGEGQLRANQIRQEGDKAADKINAEAQKQAAAIEAKATDPLQKAVAKKAAEKVREEGRKKAEAAKGEFYLRARQTEEEAGKRSAQIQNEADKNADKIEKEASDKADQLLKEAEEKSKIEK
ncbi:MAG: AsmA family protein [Bacteroidetes bacterium]|nr:AsmA family protein [Bacteroidota bacterium]